MSADLKDITNCAPKMVTRELAAFAATAAKGEKVLYYRGRFGDGHAAVRELLFAAATLIEAGRITVYHRREHGATFNAEGRLNRWEYIAEKL